MKIRDAPHALNQMFKKRKRVSGTSKAEETNKKSKQKIRFRLGINKFKME